MCSYKGRDPKTEGRKRAEVRNQKRAGVGAVVRLYRERWLAGRRAGDELTPGVASSWPVSGFGVRPSLAACSPDRTSLFARAPREARKQHTNGIQVAARGVGYVVVVDHQGEVQMLARSGGHVARQAVRPTQRPGLGAHV